MNRSNHLQDVSPREAKDARASAARDEAASIPGDRTAERSSSAPPLSAIFNVEVHHPDAIDGEDRRAQVDRHDAPRVSRSEAPERNRGVSEHFEAAARNSATLSVKDLPHSLRPNPETELEALEAERARPALNDNLPPPKNAAKAVHAEIEAWREARILELRATLAEQNESAYGQTDELGLAI
jgi:hypothetical protein